MASFNIFSDVKSMFKEELREKLVNFGMLAYKADQVYRWVTSGVSDFYAMTNLRKEERELLKLNFFVEDLDVERILDSCDGSTRKYLFKLRDGEFVESVLMKYKYGYTACISVQVGCRMGCKFCATGSSGFCRDLTPGEMISQVQKMSSTSNVKISHIVLMGMGEPLDNYVNVVKFLKIVSSKDSLNIGRRNISLSTCGIVDKIYDLTNENFGLTLSVSLHASSDSIREKIMPINKKYKIVDILDACMYYVNKTKRRVSFEYTMIQGLNDSPVCAAELACRLKNILCHVNLINLNKTCSKGKVFEPATSFALNRFKTILQNKGINTTIRRSLGSDIAASCGQLRNRKVEEMSSSSLKEGRK